MLLMTKMAFSWQKSCSNNYQKFTFTEAALI